MSSPRPSPRPAREPRAGRSAPDDASPGAARPRPAGRVGTGRGTAAGAKGRPRVSVPQAWLRIPTLGGVGAWTRRAGLAALAVAGLTLVATWTRAPLDRSGSASLAGRAPEAARPDGLDGRALGALAAASAKPNRGERR